MRGLALALALLAAGCASTAPIQTLRDGRAGAIKFRSVTILGQGTAPTWVTGELSVPAGVAGRVPAVIVLHACAGVKPNLRDWARELNGAGYAALVLDSFDGRGVDEVCSGREQVSIPSRLIDAYRATALLGTHPHIDPQRIALMGFAQGGWVALWASHAPLQRRFMPPGTPQFAAYLPVYPDGCNARLKDETDISGGPVRIFQGDADDWTPIEPCRAYVERMRAAGRDVSLVPYEGALHAFDVPSFATPHHFAELLNASHCEAIQQADGRFVDADGRPVTPSSPCVTRGASMGYDAGAHRQLVADVKAFLADAFSRVGSR
jgi:dienelactone hydrolase